MNYGEETYEHIEAYLNGELKGSRLRDFEDRMRNESMFQDKVNTHKLANLLVKKNSLIHIKTFIANEDKSARRFETFKKISIALLVSSIIWGIWTYYFTDNKTSLPDTTQQPVKVETETIQNPVAIPMDQTHQPDSFFKKKRTIHVLTQQLSGNEVEPIEKVNIPVSIKHEDEPQKKQHATISSEKTVEQIKPANICANVVLVAHITVNPTCREEHNGNIYISGIKGGKDPYKTEIYNNNELVSSQNLDPGNYRILVKDANHCLREFENIEVKVIDCTKDYSLNPFIGDLWEIPVYSSAGTLTIYDEIGNIYFRTEIAAGAKENWNGKSSSGELKTGFFPFIIKYSDGTSKDGSVSIGK